MAAVLRWAVVCGGQGKQRFVDDFYEEDSDEEEGGRRKVEKPPAYKVGLSASLEQRRLSSWDAQDARDLGIRRQQHGTGRGAGSVVSPRCAELHGAHGGPSQPHPAVAAAQAVSCTARHALSYCLYALGSG